jgi:hypothetical protein
MSAKYCSVNGIKRQKVIYCFFLLRNFKFVREQKQVLQKLAVTFTQMNTIPSSPEEEENVFDLY